MFDLFVAGARGLGLAALEHRQPATQPVLLCEPGAIIMEPMADRLLYVIANAAPPAQDLHLIAPRMRTAGWTLCIVPTPHAVPFLDVNALQHETPHPILSEYRRPGDNRLPPPDGVLIAPMTYNTVNKWAAGIADTFALGLLAEFIGTDSTPVVAVPWAKEALTRHPAFARSIDLLRSCGAHVIFDRAMRPLNPAQLIGDFPWEEALDALSVASIQRDA